MARDPFDPVRLTEPLRPRAEPIDTFVQVEVPQRDDSLAEFARGLTAVSSGLDSFLAQRRARADEEDKIRAEADFHANNRVGYAEAVRQGLVPAQHSRAYMDAYRQTEGDVAGARLQQKFKAAYDAWGDKGSTDPNAFDNFLAGFIRDNLPANTDPGVLRGLMPRLRVIAENGNAQNIADVSRITKERAVNAKAAQIDGRITTENGEALGNRRQPNWRGVTQQIMRDRAAHIAAGGDAEAIDKQIVDAVTAQALQLRGEGPKLLDAFFNSNVPGTNHTWGATPYGRDQKAKTIAQLEVLGRQAQVEDRRVQAEREKKALDDVTRRMITSIDANPSAPLPEDLIKEGEKLDGEFRTKSIAWQKTLLSGRGRSDPAMMTQLHREVMEGGGMAVIRRALDAGMIQTPEDLKSVLALNEQVEKHGKRVADIMGTSSATAIMATIKERTDDKNDMNRLFAPGGLTDAGLRLQHDFRMQVLAWSVANPNATVIEQEKAIAEIGKRVLDSFSRPPLGSVQYGRDTASPENPYVGGTASGLPTQPPPAQTAPTATPAPANGTPTQPAAPQVPAPSPPPQVSPPAPPAPQPTMPVDPAPAQQWFNSLPPEVQQEVRRRAQLQGRNVGQVIMDGYRRAIEQGSVPRALDRRSEAEVPNVQLASLAEGVASAVQAAQDDPASSEVFQRVTQLITRALGDEAGPRNSTEPYQLAVLNDDPKAARILDFVAGPESNGNYNATYADAAGKKAKITDMTINQVYAMMRERGGPSTAAGRYQIIRKTAQGLMRRMGLSGDEKFTPELQDRMAIQLLKDRGYDRWRAGTMSTEAFANALAMEWASLPNLSTGRSHYAGDGLNKSHVTPRQVLRTLGNPDEA